MKKEEQRFLFLFFLKEEKRKLTKLSSQEDLKRRRFERWISEIGFF